MPGLRELFNKLLFYYFSGKPHKTGHVGLFIFEQTSIKGYTFFCKMWLRIHASSMTCTTYCVILSISWFMLPFKNLKKLHLLKFLWFMILFINLKKLHLPWFCKLQDNESRYFKSQFNHANQHWNNFQIKTLFWFNNNFQIKTLFLVW